MEEDDAEPRFFIDRGIGSRIVPGALRDAGWTLVTMDERYGKQVSQSTDDVDWIADAAQRGEVSLCKDTAVAANPDEAQTIYMHEARVFAFSNKHLTGAQMAELLLRWEVEIFSIARRVAGAYVFAVSNPASPTPHVALPRALTRVSRGHQCAEIRARLHANVDFAWRAIAVRRRRAIGSVSG